MKKQEKKPVTVVSEGLVFEGVRTPFAFVWVESGVVQTKAAKSPTALSNYAHDFLRDANMSTADKAWCRRQVAEMSAKDLQGLIAKLRGFRRSSSQQ
jgi:hypothetical protein